MLEALTSMQPSELQNAESRREEVARDLMAISYSVGTFVTTAGIRTDYHLDPALFMTKPTILRRLGSLLSEYIDHNVDRVVGTEPGSIALAAAVALQTGLPFVSLRAFPDRPSKWSICGELHAGERVVLLEDVLSSGTHALQGVEALVTQGAIVAGIVGVVDRGEGAGNAIDAAGFALFSLYNIKNLVSERNPAPPE